MLVNSTKTRLAEGTPVFGCFLRYAEPSLAEFIALQGWDFMVLDGEHGTLEPRDIENLARAVELRGVTPIARVPTNQPHDILRFLDTGIHGVHVPWVNSAAEAQEAIRSVKYWPKGHRGLAGSRASLWGMTEPIGAYTVRANEETLVVVHIETIAAVNAIDDYVALDGIDVLFIGPTDLSHSLGHPGDTNHPEVVEAMDTVAAAVIPSGKALGIFVGNADVAATWVSRGATYVATGPDGFLKKGMQQYLEDVRGTP
jgi:4-hydroxy-2-oxoheptanedioate aldolase